MIDLLLHIGFVRNKLLFHLKHKYFHEFEHSIPLESGYWAHLLEKDSYDSFSEIFIKQEYLEFIPDEPISRITGHWSPLRVFQPVASVKTSLKLNLALS